MVCRQAPVNDQPCSPLKEHEKSKLARKGCLYEGGFELLASPSNVSPWSLLLVQQIHMRGCQASSEGLTGTAGKLPLSIKPATDCLANQPCVTAMQAAYTTRGRLHGQLEHPAIKETNDGGTVTMAPSAKVIHYFATEPCADDVAEGAVQQALQQLLNTARPDDQYGSDQLPI